MGDIVQLDASSGKLVARFEGLAGICLHLSMPPSTMLRNVTIYQERGGDVVAVRREVVPADEVNRMIDMRLVAEVCFDDVFTVGVECQA